MDIKQRAGEMAKDLDPDCVAQRDAREREMRDSTAPTPKTAEELRIYIEGLASEEHSYGTAVYAMSLAATAAYNYVASTLGVTGFQASCADLDIIKRTRGYKHGFRLVDYSKLLYPQYWNEEHFPTPGQMLAENAERLRPVAYEMLREHPEAAEGVRDHWDRIARWMTYHECAKQNIANKIPGSKLPKPLTIREVNTDAGR